MPENTPWSLLYETSKSNSPGGRKKEKAGTSNTPQGRYRRLDRPARAQIPTPTSLSPPSPNDDFSLEPSRRAGCPYKPLTPSNSTSSETDKRRPEAYVCIMSVPLWGYSPQAPGSTRIRLYIRRIDSKGWSPLVRGSSESISYRRPPDVETN